MNTPDTLAFAEAVARYLPRGFVSDHMSEVHALNSVGKTPLEAALILFVYRQNPKLN